ncbi:AraC family transcriptional regulator [Algibacter lectus]|uniref:AraC family transcriptional regulator n=1 Tax=Algibacter lectus TaxID=221126 RepID=UPI0026F0EA29|nr:AraC family transcriptional regulator [Algibacter lectus]MDO7135971.1 AraC family transcriptional regulator [Algibacter lectus]
MKLVLKDSNSYINKRLTADERDIPCLDVAWHYHSQFELLYVTKSTGIRFVGDSVAPFYPGELVLVGGYLPHLWRNDPEYYKDNNELRVKTIVIKFLKNFIGEDTFKNSAFSEINDLLDISKFGVSFGRSVSKKLHNELMEIPHLSPGEQSIKLLDVLYRLAKVEDKTLLSMSDMRQYTLDKPDRLDNVIRYISDNYAREISLTEIAEIACMTTNSFCRFFKKMTNKSFTEFLNEVRIRNASRLLVQENLPISEICYAVGYKSIPNFNKQFKLIINCTPKEYRYSL